MNITELRARVVRLALHPCDATDANYDLLVRLLDVAEAAEQVVAIDADPNGSVDANGVAIDALKAALTKLKDTP